MKSVIFLLFILISCNPDGKKKSKKKKQTTQKIVAVSGCPDGQHSENGFCVNNVKKCAGIKNGEGILKWQGSAWGSCEIFQCDRDYHNEGGLCKYNLESCTVGSATGRRSFGNGEWGPCVVFNCPNNTHIENGACISNSRSCVVSRGVGNQIWDKSWGPCNVISCQTGFHKENGSCISNRRGCSLDRGYEEYVSGAWSSCKQDNCSKNNHKEGDVCVSNFRSCLILDKGTTIGHGSQVFQSNAWQPCIASTCLSDYHIENRTCVSNTMERTSALGIKEERTYSNGSWGGWAVSFCPNTHHMEGPNCIENIRGCSSKIAFGTGIETWDGSKWVCKVKDCEANYHKKDEFFCEYDTANCLVNNGVGTKVWNNGWPTTCTLSKCNNGSHEESGACVLNKRECRNDFGVGNEDYDLNANAWTNVCVMTADGCNNDAHLDPATSLCASDTAVCATTDGTRSGQKKWQGTGYGACHWDDCTGTQHSEGENCVENIQACTTNGVGSKSWQGTEYSKCVYTSCTDPFILSEGKCVANENYYKNVKNNKYYVDVLCAFAPSAVTYFDTVRTTENIETFCEAEVASLNTSLTNSLLTDIEFRLVSSIKLTDAHLSITGRFAKYLEDGTNFVSSLGLDDPNDPVNYNLKSAGHWVATHGEFVGADVSWVFFGQDRGYLYVNVAHVSGRRDKAVSAMSVAYMDGNAQRGELSASEHETGHIVGGWHCNVKYINQGIIDPYPSGNPKVYYGFNFTRQSDVDAPGSPITYPNAGTHQCGNSHPYYSNPNISRNFGGSYPYNGPLGHSQYYNMYSIWNYNKSSMSQKRDVRVPIKFAPYLDEEDCFISYSEIYYAGAETRVCDDTLELGSAEDLKSLKMPAGKIIILGDTNDFSGNNLYLPSSSYSIDHFLGRIGRPNFTVDSIKMIENNDIQELLNLGLYRSHFSMNPHTTVAPDSTAVTTCPGSERLTGLYNNGDFTGIALECNKTQRTVIGVNINLNTRKSCTDGIKGINLGYYQLPASEVWPWAIGQVQLICADGTLNPGSILKSDSIHCPVGSTATGIQVGFSKNKKYVYDMAITCKAL